VAASGRRIVLACANGVLIGLVVAAAMWPQATHARKTGWVGAPGPEQPIAFYHRVHVQELHIPCQYCHFSVESSRVADYPSLDICWGCHKDISITHPEIQKLRADYLSDTPVQWVRVNHEPDYVHFAHDVHVAAGVPCAQCHGDVGSMDVVYQPIEMNMGWCVTCHRSHQTKFHPRQAAVDCQTCHY